ncbi:MAG: ABC transporter permease [Synergistaceae bacterium]|nr:ABC transporter permease [Synergistaceae bacterium]
MRHLKAVFVSLFVPALFLILWAYMAERTGNDVILPPIGQVAAHFASPGTPLIGMGSLVSNILISMLRVLVGYSAAVLLAVPAGLLLGHKRQLSKLFTPFLGLFRPIPPLAWVPLVLAWFGVASFATLFGVEEGTWYVFLNNLKFSMVFIIFIGAFYPILSGTMHGVSGVRSILVDSARVLGASDRDIFLKVLLPASLPSIVNGLRIGLGVAWMCLVSAEMLPGSISGVGYLITHAYTVARTDIVITGMITIGLLGAAMDHGFRFVEERSFQWQRLTR